LAKYTCLSIAGLSQVIPTDFGDFWETFALSWAVSSFPWVAAGATVAMSGRTGLSALGPSPGLTWVVKEIICRHFEGKT
jgi:hypothetical protein